MLKRPHYIALSLVLFLVLVILNLPSQTATQSKLAIGGLFLPLFGLAGSAHALAAQAGNSLTPRPALLNQLEQLRRENDRFRVRDTQVEEVWRENDRLRAGAQLAKASRPGSSGWPAWSCAIPPTGGAQCRSTWANATESSATCPC